MKITSPVSYLRVFSILDALSWIYLLYCYLYLKIYLGNETATKIPGMTHGIIFCFFGIALLISWKHKGWSFKTTILIGLAATIPFLPFWLETWLKKQDN